MQAACVGYHSKMTPAHIAGPRVHKPHVESGGETIAILPLHDDADCEFFSRKLHDLLCPV